MDWQGPFRRTSRQRGTETGAEEWESVVWFEFVITCIRGCDGLWIKSESIDCFNRNNS